MKLEACRSLSVGVQRAVLARDGLICQWCGGAVVRSPVHRPDRLHFDHVVQWSHGGSSDADNIVVSCARCNLGRAKSGGNVRTPLLRLYGFSYGFYRWLADVDVPRPLVGAGLALRDYAHSYRTDPTRIVGQILRGELAATPEGRIYVELGNGRSQRGRLERRMAR